MQLDSDGGGGGGVTEVVTVDTVAMVKLVSMSGIIGRPPSPAGQEPCQITMEMAIVMIVVVAMFLVTVAMMRLVTTIGKICRSWWQW